MVYLKEFSIPDDKQESDYVCFEMKEMDQSCYSQNVYPFKVFNYKRVPTLEFEPITIFYGNNGSGKSTLLNLICEKLRINRTTNLNVNPYFSNYLQFCRYGLADRTRELPRQSRFIASDDIFDFMLNIRAINEGVDIRRHELFDEYNAVKSDFIYNGPYPLKSLDDYDEFKRRQDMKRQSRNQYTSPKLNTEINLKSNGENALAFFTSKIQENALYLLDEPENSLSSEYQLQLAEYLENAARFFNCQLIISTHSPFLLAMKGAKIYDLDSVPVTSKRWTELKNVRIYHDFFEKHREKF